MVTSSRTRSEGERKEQILSAARAVFDERGYENATVSEIVRRAGVAQGTFYLYFATKKDAVIELARRPMEEIAQGMREIGAEPRSFSEVLASLVHIAFRVSRRSPDLCRLMHLGDDASTEETIQGTEAGRDVKEGMHKLFRDAAAAGELSVTESDIAAHTFKQILSGALKEASFSEEPGYTDRLEGTTTELVINAFVKTK